MKKLGRVLLKPLVGARSLGQSLHQDDRGDNENLGRLLILALVLVPLVVLIALFGQQIFDKATEKWNEVIGADVGK